MSLLLARARKSRWSPRLLRCNYISSQNLRTTIFHVTVFLSLFIFSSICCFLLFPTFPCCILPHLPLSSIASFSLCVHIKAFSIPSCSPAFFKHLFSALIKHKRSVLAPLITHFCALTLPEPAEASTEQRRALICCLPRSHPLYFQQSFSFPPLLSPSLSHLLTLRICLPLCSTTPCSTSH